MVWKCTLLVVSISNKPHTHIRQLFIWLWQKHTGLNIQAYLKPLKEIPWPVKMCDCEGLSIHFQYLLTVKVLFSFYFSLFNIIHFLFVTRSLVILGNVLQKFVPTLSYRGHCHHLLTFIRRQKWPVTVNMFLLKANMASILLKNQTHLGLLGSKLSVTMWIPVFDPSVLL